MNVPAAVLGELRRYREIVRSLMSPTSAFQPESESGTAVQVERGTVFAMLLIDRGEKDMSRVERLIELSRSPRLTHIAVVDRTGHHRPIYRPLLTYAWLQAFRMSYETLPRPEFGRWEESLRVYSDLLESSMGEVEWSENSLTASYGATASELAWTALALFAAGKVFIRDAWTDLASDFFGKLILAQQADGAFLASRPSDNPETRWYHELAILHAAASYAVQAEDRTLAATVARNTEFHLKETQPDHATGLPLGLFAFIWNPAARPLADQLLHTLRTMHPAGAEGLSLILLGDVLHCLGLFGT